VKRISGLHLFELEGLAASREVRKRKWQDQENAGLKVVTLIATPHGNQSWTLGWHWGFAVISDHPNGQLL
jgi:hypothetical protein